MVPTVEEPEVKLFIGAVQARALVLESACRLPIDLKDERCKAQSYRCDQAIISPVVGPVRETKR